MDMGKVEVMSSCLVGNNTNIGSRAKLKLTAWDIRLLPTAYIQRALIFQKPPQFNDNLIHHLKTSLSRTLEWFPPLAGRLSTTAHDGNMSRFYVECNNAGAEFRHAVAAHVSASDILEAKHPPQIMYSFFPLNGVYNIHGVSTPLLAVQVTELADAIFIACSANHCVADGSSFWHFINSWSQISREGPDTRISRPPVFDRSCFPIPDGDLVHDVPTVEKNLMSARYPTEAHKFFHFSKESVGKLKAKANSEASTHKISSLQAVLAHIWRSIILIRCRGQPTSTSTLMMMMAVGARARMPSLPESYFGNAVYVTMVAIGEGELLDKGLGYAAMKINDVVSQQTNEAVLLDAQKQVEYQLTSGDDRMPSADRLPLIIGSSTRHDVYGNDFGWGKPISVRSGEALTRYDGLAVVFPAPEADGIDVELCLAQETFDAMEYDADFMGAFTIPPPCNSISKEY